MKLSADRAKCVGAGTCVAIAPDFFDQDDADGTVILLAEQVEQDRLDVVEQAVDFCPAQALLLAGKG